MAQNLPGAKIRLTLQSELKKLGGQKKSEIPYFQAPGIKFWFRSIIETSLTKKELKTAFKVMDENGGKKYVEYFHL